MSNKMPKANGAKTASVHKRRKQLFVFGVVLFVIAASVWALTRSEQQLEKPSTEDHTTYCLETSESKRICDVNLEPATTIKQQAQGLSGRTGLADNQGMVFIFDQAGEQCFWMKDMEFSIDMVFIDEFKKVIKIYERVTPDTYPQNYCADGTKYVIELTEGKAHRADLQVGSQLEF